MAFIGAPCAYSFAPPALHALIASPPKRSASCCFKFNLKRQFEDRQLFIAKLFSFAYTRT